MGLHGIEVNRATGGTRPVDVGDGEAVGLMASVDGGATEGELHVLRTPADVTALDSGGGSLAPKVSAIRKQTAAPIILNVVDAGNLADAAGNAATFTYAYRFLQAESEVGIRPTMFPQALVGNVGSDLLVVASRLLGMAFLDGPNTDDASAIADVASFDSPRAMYFDPGVVDTEDNTVGLSLFAAGVASALDFWEPISNKPIQGVKSLSRPISGGPIADAASQAQLLQDAKISTAIRSDGWQLWGGRSLSSDPQFRFASVGRTDDRIVAAIQNSFQWAVDKGLTASFIEDVVDSVKGFMGALRGRGAILYGDAYPDKNLNTPTTIAAGELYINYEFTPVYQAESLKFTRHITAKGIEELFS